MRDDDTLPAIDLSDEDGDGDLTPAATPEMPGRPVLPVSPIPPVWRQGPAPRRRVGRMGVAVVVLAAAVVSLVGSAAWSSMDRRVPTDAGLLAGDFADLLQCGGDDPRVANTIDYGFGSAPLERSRSLPMPPWLRDRSLGATKIRTARDAARWLNANTTAAAAFRHAGIASWDAGTRHRLARAEEWMRSWWSRHGDTAPPGWTEKSAVAAARRAAREDRVLTEEIARKVEGTLRWRPLQPPPGRDAGGNVAIGGRRGNGLVEVLVYRASADGLLRVQGRAYCDDVDSLLPEFAPHHRTDTSARHEANPPAAAPPLACGPLRGPVFVQWTSHGPPPPPRPPDGHTAPRRAPNAPAGAHLPPDPPEPAMTAAETLDRFAQDDHSRSDTEEGRLAYEIVSIGDLRGVAVGRHQGEVKVIVDMERHLGGWWSASTRMACSRHDSLAL